MTEHSPTPFDSDVRPVTERNYVRIQSAGKWIGTMYAPGDAVFVVRACNAHEELVRALREIAVGTIKEDFRDGQKHQAVYCAERLVGIAQDALAKLKPPANDGDGAS